MRERISKFVGVGSVGFTVDSLVFFFGCQILDPALARPIAIAVAMLCTWILNRHFTFGDRRSGNIWRELAHYVAASLTAVMCNLAVYYSFSWLLGTQPWSLTFAFVAGVGVGMVLNFCLYHFVVYAPTKSQPAEG